MSPSIAELARRNHAALLKGMAAVSQARVAELINVTPTKISRTKDEDLELFTAMLAACNLMVVPRSFQTVDPDRLRALTILAREALERETSTSEWFEATP